jgi:hypothetical protein
MGRGLGQTPRLTHLVQHRISSVIFGSLGLYMCKHTPMDISNEHIFPG